MGSKCLPGIFCVAKTNNKNTKSSITTPVGVSGIPIATDRGTNNIYVLDVLSTLANRQQVKGVHPEIGTRNEEWPPL